MIYLWNILQLIIGYNLIFPVVLWLINLVKPSNNKLTTALSSFESDYAVIVTAYGQTHTLNAVLDSIVKLNYSNFLVYMVLDNCQHNNYVYDNDKVIVLKPSEILANNVKSHLYAIDNFKRVHDRVTIIDSDNLVDRNYLFELNKFFDSGYHAVQGIRIAKNLNTIYACLDAARDIYYHFYDGKLLFEAGSSATLSGSGMAFSLELYLSIFRNKVISGAGFDKVLQFEILKRKTRIAFTSLAIVEDEKTSNTDQLVNQRARWINTWFKYFKFGFTLIGMGIKCRSWNQFLFGIVLLRPPLFIFLILSFIFMILNIWIVPGYVLIWAVGFLLFICSFILALVRSNADMKIYKSLLSVPKFVFYQLNALIYSSKANKRSVATVHLNENSKLEKISN